MKFFGEDFFKSFRRRRFFQKGGTQKLFFFINDLFSNTLFALILTK